MLFTCENHGDAVIVFERTRGCYGTPDCPMCKADERVSELEQEVEALKDQVSDLKEELEDKAE